MKEQTEREIVNLVSHLFITGTFLCILIWGIKVNHRLDALERTQTQNTECISVEQADLAN